MRVFWTPGARQRLQEIEAYISKERSPDRQLLPSDLRDLELHGR